MDVLKIIIPSVLTCIVAFIITPYVSNFLYKNELWKKKNVEKSIDGTSTTVTSLIQQDHIRKTPRMGGVIIWLSVLITIICIYILSQMFNGVFLELSYFSRSGTWIPLSVLIGSGLFGLIDDYFVCKDKGTYKGGGLSLKSRLLFVFIFSLFVSIWFYVKLDIQSISLISGYILNLGIFFIPVFILVITALYGGGIIDGVDGLSGGVFATMFSAYAIISYAQGQVDIAALCMSIVGGILTFLWFNVPPARFFMSETGSMALTLTLGVVAFLTSQVFVLVFIAFPLFATALSSIIQLLSKKFRHGKKVFLVAPLHNHFQALGWPPYKVTMRYWIVSILCSITGVIVALL